MLPDHLVRRAYRVPREHRVLWASVCKEPRAHKVHKEDRVSKDTAVFKVHMVSRVPLDRAHKEHKVSRVCREGRAYRVYRGYRVFKA